jgi:hypothetical protein
LFLVKKRFRRKLHQKLILEYTVCRLLYLWEAGWIDGVGLAADPHYWNVPDLLELRYLAPSHRVLLQAPILVPNN